MESLIKLAESGQAETLLKLLGNNIQGNWATQRKALSNTLLYGSGGLFSICADDNLINASVNDDGIVAALPWKPTIADVRRQPLITAMGHLAGTAQPEDQCADPPVADWRGCEIEWCLGRIRGRSPQYDRTDLGTRWCEKYPVFRTFGSVTLGGETIVPNGTQIENDAEWGAVMAAVQVKQILGRWMYTGNRTTNRHMFDGLQVLINTGYVDLHSKVACYAADSKVEDFESDCIGDPATTKSIYGYMDAVVQRIIQRARQAGLGQPRPEDMIILCRTEMAEALYEYFVCNMGACATGFGAQQFGANQYPTQVQVVTADWARQQADAMRRGSYLRVHGMKIPVVTDDYMPFTNATGDKRISDIYILTLQCSGLPLVYGEYQDMRAGIGDDVTGMYEELYGARVTDEGRFYVWQERTNTCFDMRLSLKPRLVVAAPFLQGRISNVCAQPLNPPLSSYPPDGSPYYPDGGAYSTWYDAGQCVYTE
jgi:hypothetical protein